MTNQPLTAEKELDNAAAWLRKNYGRDLPKFFDDAFHFQETGERRTPPQAKPDQGKVLTAKG